jgi:lipopolysaccharide biosynthesis protein
MPLRADPRSGRFCLFAHFDPDDHVDDYVIHHLQDLRRAGVHVVFITTSRLASVGHARIVPLCAAVIERENIGVDFGSWVTALLAYPGLMQTRLLLMANDSVYGPMHALETMLREMEESACDFFAVTESLEIKPHFQSYFLGFKRDCLRSSPLNTFLGGIDLLRRKHRIIHEYEIEMREYLERHGLRGKALVSARLGWTGNPMLSDWRRVLSCGGPYLKVQLLRDNPCDVAIEDWPGVVQALGYDPKVIRQHLRRIAAGSCTDRERLQSRHEGNSCSTRL